MARSHLSRADLSRAALFRANLFRATLIGAKLNKAYLREADLIGADLSEADLSEADLREAYLREADLYLAILNKTKFIKDDLVNNTNIALALLNQIPQSQEEKRRQQATKNAPTIRIRIEEKPLTAYQLSNTLNSLTSLYVKMWLLQQHRFDDFLSYTNQRNPQLEQEANLLIEELKYNSPADIKFSFVDLKPIAEAFQIVVDTITQRKHRAKIIEEESKSKHLDNQLKEETLKKEQLKTKEQYADTAIHMTEAATRMVELLYPELTGKQKRMAIQSLLTDMSQLGQSPILEISIALPPAAPSFQPPNSQTVEVEEEPPIQKTPEPTTPVSHQEAQ